MNIKWIGNAKFSSRQGYPILGIMNHIMDGTLAGTAAHFANPTVQASAHYGVGKRGELHQYVKDEHAAWHAGSVKNPRVQLPHPNNITPNLYTIGIEWEGRPGDVITEAQYQAGLALHRHLLSKVVDVRLPLRQRIIGHFQTNSIDRPNCPGPSFPWERLYADLAQFDRKVPGPRILVEGKELPIQIISGRSFAPVRDLLEALGYTVIWYQSIETVFARKEVK